MPELIRAYDHLYFPGILRNGDSYVEIGAFEGKFLKESGLVRKGCWFYLFEPAEPAFRRLREAFPYSNVHLFQIAVAEQAGPRQLLQSWDNPEGNTIVHKELNNTTTVQALSVAGALEIAGNFVRFMTINAECSEYEILQFPSLHLVDYISCEFHPGKSGVDTEAFVAKYLEETFRTVAIARKGEPYNIWFGMNRRLTEEPPTWMV